MRPIPFVLVLAVIASFYVVALVKGLKQPKPQIIEADCTRIIAAPLHTQGSFVHFDGVVVSESRPWSQIVDYDIRFPGEIRDGYLTLIEEYVGHSTYLLWTENPAFEHPGQKIKFWGFTDNITTIEETTVLYPMVKSK